MKSASWQNRCLGNTLTLSIKKMKTQFLLKQGDPLSFNYRSERGGAGVLRQVLGGLTYRSHQRDVLSPQCSSKKKQTKSKNRTAPCLQSCSEPFTGAPSSPFSHAESQRGMQIDPCGVSHIMKDGTRPSHQRLALSPQIHQSLWS